MSYPIFRSVKTLAMALLLIAPFGASQAVLLTLPLNTGCGLVACLWFPDEQNNPTGDVWIDFESASPLGDMAHFLVRPGFVIEVTANFSGTFVYSFETDANAVLFVWPGGEVEELPLIPKSEVAGQLLDRVEKLRAERRA